MKLLLLALSCVGCDHVFGLSDVTVEVDAPPRCPTDYNNSFGSSQYRLVTTALPFVAAATDCADDEASAAITGHTHLSVLSSLDETAYLYSLGGNRWVGLSDLAVTGTWRWITDEDALDPSAGDAQLWATGEPNNPGVEDCAHFDSQHANLANNVICSETHTYACECDDFANIVSSYE